MMATLDLSLAWSVKVPVEVLGPHLQAYVQLQPTISALRLCHRYGKGELAAVTTLPVELVNEIEGYLVEAERKVQRENWEKDYTCFQGLCKPLDHLSNSEQVDLWQDLFSKCDYCGGCHDSCKTAMKTLSKGQRTSLENFLQEVMDDEGPEESSWWVEHENRSTRWQGKTGSPTAKDRGLLSKCSNLLIRNFGLDLWVTHTQPKEAKKGQFTAVEVYASTSAYLKLPSESARKEFRRGYYDHGGYTSRPFVPTESGGDIQMPLPSQLSKEDISRFSRALKTLGLAPTESEDSKKPASSSSPDKKDTTKQKDEAMVQSADRKDWTPRLRVLYSSAADDEF